MSRPSPAGREDARAADALSLADIELRICQWRERLLAARAARDGRAERDAERRMNWHLALWATRREQLVTNAP